MSAIGDCVLVDPLLWSQGVEDFENEGSEYGFAGFIFRKLDQDSIRIANVTPVWRDLLAKQDVAATKRPVADKMTTIKRFFSKKR